MNWFTKLFERNKEPEFSDIEKALLKSLIDEPGSWEINAVKDDGLAARHRVTGVHVTSGPYYEGGWGARAASGKLSFGAGFSLVWHDEVREIHADRERKADEIAAKAAEVELRRRLKL